MELHVLGYDHADAVELTAEIQREHLARYGELDETPVRAEEFLPPGGLFVVGYVAGQPVACAGWRTPDAGHGPALAGDDAELKRLYVRPSARGAGFARQLLGFLEGRAGAAGMRRVVLETGTAQPEAMSLYSSAGYHPIPGFGVYRDAPNSRCFAKPLPGDAGFDSGGRSSNIQV